MINQPGLLEFSPKDRVLVTGASGTIGPSLIQRLLALGLKVRVFSRNPAGYDQFSDQIEVFLGDVRDIGAIKRAMTGVQIVFHLAAKLHQYNPSPEDTEEYQQINVQGTRNVVTAALEEGVSRLVYFSTINVYGPGESGVVFTEQSVLNPKTVYSQTKAKAEKIVIEDMISREGESRGVILRLGAVYGPRMKGNYLFLFKGLKDGWFIPIGEGENRRTLINIEDVVSGAFLAAFHPQACGKIYNLTDGNVYSLKQIIDVMCKVLNRKSPAIFLPAAPVKFSIGIIEDILAIFGKKTLISRNLVNTILEERAVSGDLIQTDLNFKPSITIETGWSEIVQSLWMVKD